MTASRLRDPEDIAVAVLGAGRMGQTHDTPWRVLDDAAAGVTA